MKLGGSQRATYGPVRVPDGRYFMMGDNRDDSLDSRWFGLVDGTTIAGRAVGIAGSLDPGRYYCPRWERFFTPLL